MPVHSDVLAAAREWVASLTGERMAFYSAAEELDAGIAAPPEPAPKRKVQATAKRATNAQLAEQLDSMLALLPALAQQVQDLSSRQTVLEAKAKGPPSNKAPASDVPLPHRAAFPIGLAPHTQNPLGSLRGLVGPPPKVRAPVLQHPPPPLVAQDAPQEELGQDPITGDCRDELLCRRNAETEPGLGHIGVAFGSSGRRRRVFVGAGFRFPAGHPGCGKTRKVAGAVGCQVRFFSSAGEPTGPETACARRPGTTDERGLAAPAAALHSVCRKVRRVWRSKVPRHSLLAASQRCRHHALGRPCGSGGALGSQPDSGGASSSGQRLLGHWLSAVVAGGSAASAVPASTSESESPLARLRGADPPTMGHDDSQLHPGNRCDPRPAVGDDFRDQGKSLGIRPGCIYACTGLPATVPQEGQRLCCSSGLGLAPSGVGVDVPPSFRRVAGPSSSAPTASPRRFWFRGSYTYKPKPPDKGSSSPQPVPECAAGVRDGTAPGLLLCFNSVWVRAVEPSSALCSAEPARLLQQPAGSFVKPAPSPSPSPPKLLGFRAYGLSLAARIGRTRGAFGAFLSVPFPGCFQHVPSAKSSRVRSRIASRRVAHVAVMACNFLFSGCRPPPLQLLRRQLNKVQAKALRYVASLCGACGAVEPFAVSSAGRRSAQLLASLSELSEHLTWMGPGTDPYGSLFHGAAPGPSTSSSHHGPSGPTSSSPAPASSEASEGDAAGRNRPLESSPLRPYAPLNAERLKITSLGHWDPVPFLQDDPDLAIACLEPDVLLYGGSPPALEVPSLARESAQEIAALAKKWDSNNLLFLKDSYEDQVSFRDSVRIFNCYKNEACDRQIGDRRARNYRGRALRGPSVGLPCGPSLLGLALDPRHSTLRIWVTDRKDFYHQLQARPRKAAQNALYPPVLEAELAGTQALALLHQRRAFASGAPPRPGDSGFAPLLVDPAVNRKVIACFQAVCQGDHLGVEIATASHRSLLKRAGLLQEGQEVRADQIFPGSPLIDGLVIDDYYSISVESVGTSPQASLAHRCLDIAAATYSAHRLLGSAEKDIKGADLARS